MNPGDYIVHKLTIDGKMQEQTIDPASFPTPGDPIKIFRGNAISHKEYLGSDSEADFRQYVDKIGPWPLLISQRHNGDSWISESFLEVRDNLKPSTPSIFEISKWINDHVRPYTGELPDKGVWFELELQFWMNHYYEVSRGERQVYHRSLTFTKVIHLAMLRTNYDDPDFVPGALREISSSGSFVAYSSDPVLYNGVLASGELQDDAFIISIVPVGTDYNLEILNNLQTMPGWEDFPDWRVYLQIRGRVKEFSTYDRTNEIV